MTDLQNLLDQIDRLDQQATTGPWYQGQEKMYESPVDVFATRDPEDPGAQDIATYMHSEKDAEFIALARTALPKLGKALRAVLELHKPSELYPAVIPGVIYCVSCWDGVIDEAYEYPCPTAQTITDALGDDDA